MHGLSEVVSLFPPVKFNLGDLPLLLFSTIPVDADGLISGSKFGNDYEDSD